VATASLFTIAALVFSGMLLSSRFLAYIFSLLLADDQPEEVNRAVRKD